MAEASLILSVNCNRRNLELLEQFLVKNGYAVVNAATLNEMAALLEQESSIRMALVDITAFDTKIWEQCETLRQKSIPFLIFSPRQISAIQQTEIMHSAHGVIVKPLVTQELLILIKQMLAQE
ncbi:MAG: response regulator receiver protein [uncultured bacterium]|nr:MAG: response regulator receiver protein [uncultured bacterium]